MHGCSLYTNSQFRNYRTDLQLSIACMRLHSAEIELQHSADIYGSRRPSIVEVDCFYYANSFLAGWAEGSLTKKKHNMQLRRRHVLNGRYIFIALPEDRVGHVGPADVEGDVSCWGFAIKYWMTAKDPELPATADVKEFPESGVGDGFATNHLRSSSHLKSLRDRRPKARHVTAALSRSPRFWACTRIALAIACYCLLLLAIARYCLLSLTTAGIYLHIYTSNLNRP